MQIALTLAHMYPTATFNVVQYADGTTDIENWNHADPQPTMTDIESYWSANETAILEANQPQPTELDNVKKTLTDLSYDLMMNGVL